MSPLRPFPFRERTSASSLLFTLPRYASRSDTRSLPALDYEAHGGILPHRKRPQIALDRAAPARRFLRRRSNTRMAAKTAITTKPIPISAPIDKPPPPVGSGREAGAAGTGVAAAGATWVGLGAAVGFGVGVGTVVGVSAGG